MKVYILLFFFLLNHTLLAQETTRVNRSDDDLQFVMNNELLEAGQQYVLNLKAPNLHEYVGYQYTFQFNQEKLQLDSILISDYAISINLSMSSFNLNFLDQGAFTSVWSSTGISENPDAILFSIQVTVLEDIMVDQAFSIDSELTPVFSLCANGSEAEVELIFDQVSSLREIEESSIKVFPNPVSNHLINLEWSFDQKVEQLQVFNALGKMVVSMRNGPFYSPLLIELNDLNPGIYFLKYSIKGKVYSSPFCILNK